MIPRKPAKEDFVSEVRIVERSFSMDCSNIDLIEKIDLETSFPNRTKLLITYKEPFFDAEAYAEATENYKHHLESLVKLFDTDIDYYYSASELETLKEYCEDQILRLNDIIKYCEKENSK